MSCLNRPFPGQRGPSIRFGALGLLLGGLLAVTGPASAQRPGFLHAAGPKTVNAAGQEVVLRGYNVGGWLLQESYMLGTDTLNSQWRIKQGMLRTMSEAEMEKFYRQYRQRFITKADIDFLAQQGFNCVRLPLHYDLFLTPEQRHARTEVIRDPHNDQKLDAYVQQLSQWYDAGQLFARPGKLEGIRYIDDVVKWCAANNLYVVLDLHAAPGGQGTDLNINDNFRPLDLWKRHDGQGRLIYQDITVRLWEMLAERYRSEPTIALYDLINEPHGLNAANGLSADNQELKTLYSRLIDAVRARNDQHLLMVEGNGYGNEYTNLTPDKLRVKSTANLVYNAHRYWCPNTAEAADPNPNQINLLSNLTAFRDKWQVPVWVGETGENSNDWFATAVQGLNDRGIGWGHWNIKRVDSEAGLLRIAPYGSILTPQGRAALLRNVRFANCQINRDVAASLTQPTAHQPFTPLTIPGTIPATDYDLGRDGVAYHDTYSTRTDYRDLTPHNLGLAYRNDGVDITRSPDMPNGFAVEQLMAGEWLTYTVSVATPGPYKVALRVQAEAAVAGRISLQLGTMALGTTTVPAGPGWTTVTLNTPALSAGQHTLRVLVEAPISQFGWLRFAPVNSGGGAGE